MTSHSALLHPVRLRIVQVLLGEGESTTQRLHARLSDVPIATLYRHISHLVAARLIEVSDEHQVRGASERTYRLAVGFANPTAEELGSLSAEELLTAFTVFTSGMISDFGDYLQAGVPDLSADRVSFAQASFWASAEEMDGFFAALMAALEPLLANQPSPGRRRRTLSTVLIPRAASAASRTTGERG